MVQHLSIRVPWHDHGWDGTICQDPCGNTACLKLRGIQEKKNEFLEQTICGQHISGHENLIPCLSEGVAFMSRTPFVDITTHPYVEYGYEEYKHFKPTEDVYPPYSLPAHPFGWLLKDSMYELNRKYNLGIDIETEEDWPRGKSWLQMGESHEAVFDYFYKDVIPDKSLCLIYAKQVPFIDDFGRVIIGLGHVKKVSKPKEHKRSSKKGIRSMLWESHISHSIRDDHKDGFVFPFEKILKYAEDNPEFDIKSVIVMAPDDAFSEFSYATEHVSYDAVIEVLLSCIKAFQVIDEILDEDYSNVLQWLDARLAEVWEERGAFPGLGAMLCALKVKYGILAAKEILEKAEKRDIWDIVDKMFQNPKSVLSKTLAAELDDLTCRAWSKMRKERKQLFKLLSRFDLTIEQAEVLFHENNREVEEINLSDKDIIKNPYLIYEGTRLKRSELAISVKRVDRAIFPVESVGDKYPIEKPTALKGDNDARRVRALMIYALETAAANGDTILPATILINRIEELPLQPECRITLEHLDVIEEEIDEVVLTKRMSNGGKYYKLKRFEDFSREIERKVRKKLKGERIEIKGNWSKVLSSYLNKMNIPSHPDPKKEKRIRAEKTAALKELAESKLSVLVGGAGTGKTTVLAALCSHKDIASGGVLLLAPTGKATVRLQESMGKQGETFDAYNVAQFLVRFGGFDFRDMRYKIPAEKVTRKYETVIIDEASMLTEDMLGSLMKAVGSSKRIILVGDSNQLPPIGAGRPFVDLIKILKPDFGNKFPRIKKGYCELMENCRQSSSGQRLDVEFSKMFSDTQNDPERSIVSEIMRGSGENIKVIRWSGKEDLEEKLFGVLESEFGIKDKESFDCSLGGVRGKYGEKYSYFNDGCASNVEKWQLLSPVKNMPQGVLNLNHLIHSKYRGEEIALAGRRGSREEKKKIANPWGHESIVYGDKIINVRNMNKPGYPKGECRDYIANGEIGIACGGYKPDRSWDDNSLRVEFSSQRGSYYYYNGNNFNDEYGTNDLELAYALTVHKAQGSQFDIVILVLAEPCRLLSREMLYTALTRQKEKIVILYNDDPFKLMDYASPKYSDIAQRFTDLFSGELRTDKKGNKPYIVKVGNRYYEDSLIHRTARGELVRSKSEVSIADHLYNNGIHYEYEPEIIVDGRSFLPDFVVYDPDDDDTFWYWEHVGMPNNPEYMSRWEEKLKYYNSHGIVEGYNLIITYDGNNGSIDTRQIDKLIKETFDL